MAVYKDEDINVALINDKFPKVASAIIAQANEDAPAVTAESIKEKYPEIAASFIAEGEKIGAEAGKVEGAQAEAGRVASIDAVAMAGYEDIVAAAKADGKSTAQDVKLAIFDEMNKKSDGSAKARGADADNLAKQVADLGGAGSSDNAELTDEQEADALMDAAAKKAKGA